MACYTHGAGPLDAVYTRPSGSLGVLQYMSLVMEHRAVLRYRCSGTHAFRTGLTNVKCG